MSILEVFKFAFGKEKDAENSDCAMQRMKFILDRDRQTMNNPNFLPQLHDEIVNVLKRYIPSISKEKVEIHYDDDTDVPIIELSVAIETHKDVDTIARALRENGAEEITHQPHDTQA